jgi:hypothetical protein
MLRVEASKLTKNVKLSLNMSKRIKKFEKSVFLNIGRDAY